MTQPLYVDTWSMSDDGLHLTSLKVHGKHDVCRRNIENLRNQWTFTAIKLTWSRSESLCNLYPCTCVSECSQIVYLVSSHSLSCILLFFSFPCAFFAFSLPLSHTHTHGFWSHKKSKFINNVKCSIQREAREKTVLDV